MAPVASLQPPYSMLRREIEREQLPYCAEHDIGVVAYSPMGKGLLTGKFSPERAEALDETDHRSRDPNFSQPRLPVHLELVDGLRQIAAEAGRDAAQLAIAWVLRRPEVTSAIVGARSPRQIEETAAGGRLAAERLASSWRSTCCWSGTRRRFSGSTRRRDSFLRAMPTVLAWACRDRDSAWPLRAVAMAPRIRFYEVNWPAHCHLGRRPR